MSDKLTPGQLRDWAELNERYERECGHARNEAVEFYRRVADEREGKPAEPLPEGVEYDPARPARIVVDGEACEITTHCTDTHSVLVSCGRRTLYVNSRETSDSIVGPGTRTVEWPIPPARLPEIADWVRKVRAEAKPDTLPPHMVVHGDAVAAAIIAIGRVRELSGTVDAAIHCRAMHALGDSLRDALYAHPKIKPATRQEATC